LEALLSREVPRALPCENCCAVGGDDDGDDAPLPRSRTSGPSGDLAMEVKCFATRVVVPATAAIFVVVVGGMSTAVTRSAAASSTPPASLPLTASAVAEGARPPWAKQQQRIRQQRLVVFAAAAAANASWWSRAAAKSSPTALPPWSRSALALHLAKAAADATRACCLRRRLATGAYCTRAATARAWLTDMKSTTQIL